MSKQKEKSYDFKQEGMMRVETMLIVLVLLIVSADRDQVCQIALGMENGAISDGQLSVSSQWSPNNGANNARLHFQESVGAWSSRSNDDKQWLEIDLVSNYIKITRVATQGRADYPQWVTMYKLQYSDNGENFQYYREQGQTTDKVFYGNTDRHTVVYHQLNPPMRARYIRFRPMEWNGHVSMRVELYGCPVDLDQVAVFTISGFGKALAGHVTSSNYAADSLECMKLCLVTAQCKSFNFSEKKSICQVSGYTAKEKKQDFGDNEDFDYYEPVKHTVISMK